MYAQSITKYIQVPFKYHKVPVKYWSSTSQVPVKYHQVLVKYHKVSSKSSEVLSSTIKYRENGCNADGYQSAAITVPTVIGLNTITVATNRQHNVMIRTAEENFLQPHSLLLL
ncbi:unnamed protein product [Rotaria socialis]